MPIKYLPDVDHVVRHIPSTLVERDPDDDSVIGCFPQAFSLKPYEEYLSAYWLEFFCWKQIGAFVPNCSRDCSRAHR